MRVTSIFVAYPEDIKYFETVIDAKRAAESFNRLHGPNLATVWKNSVKRVYQL